MHGLLLVLAVQTAPAMAQNPAIGHTIGLLKGSSNASARGIVIASQLPADASAWELWGPGEDRPPLTVIGDLVPRGEGNSPGFAVNGGYWNEYFYPVGPCAGERGIHALGSHPSGFAIGAKRAAIGTLKATMTIHFVESPEESRSLSDARFNPPVLPHHTAYVIDPRAWSGSRILPGKAVVFDLERPTSAPLRLNATYRARARSCRVMETGTKFEGNSKETLWLILPGRAMEAFQPTGERLTAFGISCLEMKFELDAIEGEVRLADCAGPVLIKEGEIGGEWNTHRAMRTAIGCDQAGERLWLILLARGEDGGYGATLKETAQVLRDLGAWQGVNLDGGSSTCIWPARLDPRIDNLFPSNRAIHHGLALRGPVRVEP